MGVRQDYFIKGSDNVITLTLTEDDSAINVAWTQLDIYLGPITITRTFETNGITFSAGTLEITPGLLSEDLTTLLVNYNYPVTIKVTTATEPNGVMYGADDSDASIYFHVG